MSSAVRYCGVLNRQIANLHRQAIRNRAFQLLTVPAYQNIRLELKREYSYFGYDKTDSTKLRIWWAAFIGLGIVEAALHWQS